MGANKALVVYHGKPLIQYSIDLALRFTEDILISSNGNDLDFLGFPVVGDRFGVSAPLAGIHAGLEQSKSAWNLVLTCDMPNVSAGLIKVLLAGLPTAPNLFVPAHNGFIEPLCGFYHRDLLPEIVTNIKYGHLSPLELITKVPGRICTIEKHTAGNPEMLFKNVNSKGDVENPSGLTTA
jgi:molybdopterin-guanine dinucleotide biosynthesis protein A